VRVRVAVAPAVKAAASCQDPPAPLKVMLEKVLLPDSIVWTVAEVETKE